MCLSEAEGDGEDELCSDFWFEWSVPVPVMQNGDQIGQGNTEFFLGGGVEGVNEHSVEVSIGFLKNKERLKGRSQLSKQHLQICCIGLKTEHLGNSKCKSRLPLKFPYVPTVKINQRGPQFSPVLPLTFH